MFSINEEAIELLELLHEFKNSYPDDFSEETKRNFDLYEKALCGNAEALNLLGIV